jgi:DNA polymerase III subunit epsilon
MNDELAKLDVLALDCQAGGATPAHGDLLELGWVVCSAARVQGQVKSRWIVPRTRRPIPRAVRELTGWTEACIAEAVDERAVWGALSDDLAKLVASSANALAPTVIHFARFELPFLRDLHQRLGASGDFPFDPICVHAIGARLFPDLPRHNIRALAGFLGHSPDLVRRSAGHVEATAFIWQKLVPLLEHAGVGSWSELRAWLTSGPKPRRSQRVYPLPAERRRALPDRPGVYRFSRTNGDVVYVGKAASLRKRVAGHFSSRRGATERALEWLTQVQDVAYTETASILEAALLECDEIKRLDPPYNVHLRSGDRNAWYSSRDLRDAVPLPDDEHGIGPLPSQRALSALWAMVALSEQTEASSMLRAVVLAVPVAFGPDGALFAEGWQGFVAERLQGSEPTAARRIARASRALWLERGRSEVDPASEDDARELWDLARVRRRLERSLVQTGLLMRRARWLCLLADSTVAFRERHMKTARVLVISGGEIVERREIDDVRAIEALPVRRPGPLRARQRSFDAAVYDRMRVLATEMRRVQEEQGEACLRLGGHTFSGERLSQLTRTV